MDQSQIRNFCIIAHIDHGKSTLADRFLELTGTVDKRNMKKQVLDTMELEQERGITIKLQPARMSHTVDGVEYELNLIDTPGHVDFTYEVSRSLAAVEAAILLVDATQGVQAQTLANLYLALDQGLEIIPVLNKIDLPAADVPTRRAELKRLIGCEDEDILSVSGKTGEGVNKLLDRIVKLTPPPKGQIESSPRALLFDSHYDDYRGVVVYVRVYDGQLKKGDILHMIATDTDSEILEVGSLTPAFNPTGTLSTGEVGYVVTGLKDISNCRVGDTMTTKDSVAKPLSGYEEVKPMVFAGIFPKEGNEFEKLREAMLKLKLNDAALVFEPEQSKALGSGFRCGFLGMLHLEIIQERLQREFDMELVITVPSVAYDVKLTNGERKIIKSPADMPERSRVEETLEPWVRADIVCPKEFVGSVMQLVQDRRGIYKNTEYLDENRTILHYEMPLASIIVDFYDKLKTVTSGFASLNYELDDYRSANVVKMDILVAEEPVEALATLVYADATHEEGKKIVRKLKETIPRQMFVIKLQAAIGGKVIAGERISAMRKDVTAGLYGGDVTRKRKLLEKQKKGKKKMMDMGGGKVTIPNEAYLAVLKR